MAAHKTRFAYVRLCLIAIGLANRENSPMKAISFALLLCAGFAYAETTNRP